MTKISVMLARLKQCIPFLLVMSVFFIPISPTLKSIFIVASALGILLTSTYRPDFSFILSQYSSVAAFALFLVVVFSCLWSSADTQTQHVFIEKYSKLLFLPLFAVGFSSKKTRTLGIYAFLASMLITCVISILKDTLDPGPYPFHDPGRVFHNHVVTSYMMAFASYLSGLCCVRQVGAKRLAWLALTALYSYQILFINTGRAGYILYFILMLMLIIMHIPRRYLIVSLLCYGTLFSLLSYQSPSVSNGFRKVAAEWSHYQQGKNNSRIAYHLQFHRYAKTLFLSTPWIGQGTGGFAQAIQHDDFIPLIKRQHLLDPHSQYWLAATDSGLMGLLALVCFFTSLLVTAFHLREMKHVMLGLLVSFFIGNLSDSLLLYSAVGYLFIVFSALCISELVEENRKKSTVFSQSMSNQAVSSHHIMPDTLDANVSS